MIVGIGVDLVDIARFERSIERTPKLLDRLFTPAEQTFRPHSLAARYAAKEALIKALGGSDGVHWTDIEVASEPSGRPRFALSGTTSQTVAERGIVHLHLSLSHDAGLATAYVVLETTAHAAAAADRRAAAREALAARAAEAAVAESADGSELAASSSVDGPASVRTEAPASTPADTRTSTPTSRPPSTSAGARTLTPTEASS